MKILLTGGGSGGHFYPIIAIVEQINALVKENRLLKPEIYYMSKTPYNEGLLFENNITFEAVSAGKIRRHMSVDNIWLNFIDMFKTIAGMIHALWRLFIIYPDVVFGKGGYASFPALFAARLLRIPVVIHESDSIPGKVNVWAGKFAMRIGISYPEAVNYFPRERTAFTGSPIRKEMLETPPANSHEMFGLEKNVPTILIIGGSQGAQAINTIVIDALPELVKKYQIIHMTGKNNIKIIEETRDVILENNQYKHRYKPFGYLELLPLRGASGACDLIISRAGSTIFEIAAWGKPSIIIPIPEPTAHDQTTNAYSYARSGSALVIEEKNFTANILLLELDRILGNTTEKEKMAKNAAAFARRDASRLIAQEILSIAFSHEK